MSAIVNSNNVIFANGGGGDFPVSASFAVGGADNAKVSAITYQVVRPSQSLVGNTVTIKNELGSTGQFALIPFAYDAGLVYYNSGHIDLVNMPPEPTCSAFYITTGSPSVDFTTPASLKSLLITTPHVYGASENYTAIIDDKYLVLNSGTYCNLAKAQQEGGSIDWVVCNSGSYDV